MPIFVRRVDVDPADIPHAGDIPRSTTTHVESIVPLPIPRPAIAVLAHTALVAAATLSHRYITDRFLPDKAVDLMDEAASRLRMELDSMPTESVSRTPKPRWSPIWIRLNEKRRKGSRSSRN